MKSLLTRVAAGTLLLFPSLSAGLYALIQPFQLTPESYLLGVCLLCALLVSVLYALPDRFPRSRVVLALLALTALFLWWQWDRFLLGAEVVFHKISFGYSQELPVLYYELSAFFTEFQMARYATFFLASCALPLALWLGCWLLGGWWIWPGVATVCLLPGISLFILRQPSPLCLAALLLFLALVILSRRSYRQSAALGARRVLTALLPLALVMALLAVPASLFPYRRAVWIEDLRQDIQSLNPSKLILASGSGSQSDPGRQRFSRFGRPRFTGRTELTVQLPDEETSLLLRGFSAGVYTSGGWESLPQEVLDELLVSGADSWLYPYIATLTLDSSPNQVTVTHEGDDSDYYYTPYFLAQALPESAQAVQDAYLTRPEGVDNYTFQYYPSGDIPDGAASLSALSETGYRQWVYEHYLDVPYQLFSEETRQMIADYAARERPGKASYLDQRGYLMAQAREAADYLASFTRYDLTTGAPPLGADFLSYFLMTSHRGYCVHYATAATLLLRARGIPARYAAGYVVKAQTPGEPVKVTDREAHAWVEVYVDNFGWQPVEVTPGFPGNLQDTSATTSPTPTPTATAAPSPSASAAATATPNPGTTDTVPSGHASIWRGVLLPLAGVALIAATLWLQRYLRLRRRRRLCAQSDPNAAALELYRYLALAERRAGLPMPAQALELAQKAAFSQHILTADERRSLETLARHAHRALRSAPLWKRLGYALIWALC